jgi:hypothetical protein
MQSTETKLMCAWMSSYFVVSQETDKLNLPYTNDNDTQPYSVLSTGN